MYAQKIRRQLHMYPEVGFDLDRTLQLLREELDKLGISYTEAYGKSSIVATINPEKEHFTIGVRADIDALPIQETGISKYKSRIEGQMHACGHDAHAAIALATAKYIHEIRDEISCCVKFIFQAAEEYSTSGAKLMAEDGVMEDIDCIVALHCEPKISVGEIAIKSGEQGAISRGFKLEFHGKSAHAASQQEGIDAIMMAVQTYTAIEFMIAKEVPAKEAVVFNVGAIHGGKTNNIISEHCSMFCTLRTYTEEQDERICRRVKQIMEGIVAAYGGKAEYIPVKYYPNVYNHEEITEKMRLAAGKVIGEEHVKTHKRSMGGEDFSYFTMRKPGCIFRLGIANKEKGITSGLHHADFDIDEQSLDIGIKIFTQFILDNMNMKREDL